MTQAILSTGKRGGGKTLLAIAYIQKCIKQGRPVATNLNIFLDKLVPAWNKTNLHRLSDIPTSEELAALPLGNPNPTNEKKNGLIVLDEASTYLNSREWKDKDRTKLLGWLAQSRKYGWDLLLIAQGAEQVDVQVRKSLCDQLAISKRTDNISIPVISALMRYLLDIDLVMPKAHVVSYFNSFSGNAKATKVLTHRSEHLYAAYDTLQKINLNCKEPNDDYYGSAACTMLSHYYLNGRYLSVWEMNKKLVYTALITGAFVGLLIGFFMPHSLGKDATNLLAEHTQEAIEIQGILDTDQGFVLTTTDGKTLYSKETKSNKDGVFYKVDNNWIKVKL